MSAVETAVTLDVEAAERRASYICTDLDFAADSFETAMGRMREAIAERDDVALGYRSPGDYLSDRFGGRLARLGVDLRREVVRELTEAGLSTRAIAPVLDVSQKTVVKDRQAGDTSGITSQTPEPTLSGEADAGSGQDPEGEGTPSSRNNKVEIAPTPAPRPPVVGIDGKTYPRPAPVDHAARAEAAIRRYPDLEFYRDDAEHCWRMGDKLDEYAERGELEMRLTILRRSVVIETCERDGTPLPPVPPEIRALNAAHEAEHPEAYTHASTPTPRTCRACGQTLKDLS